MELKALCGPGDDCEPVITIMLPDEDGVPARDRDDVLQECLIGAVVAEREGRYRPQPGLEPRRILQRWMIGIAVHRARKYHEKAYRRRS